MKCAKTRSDINCKNLDNFSHVIYCLYKGDDENDEKCNDKRKNNAITIRWKPAYCFRDERLFD